MKPRLSVNYQGSKARFLFSYQTYGFRESSDALANFVLGYIAEAQPQIVVPFTSEWEKEISRHVGDPQLRGFS